MTIIIGLEHRGTVWIGGDSAGTNQLMNQTIRADKKVFIRDGLIFGFCGSFRAGQLLQHTLVIPPHAKGVSDEAYLVNDFISAVKSCLLEGQEGTAKEFEGAFLLGYRGKLYDIESDFQVGQPKTGWHAVGSGSDIGKGAMAASGGIRNPKKRLELALQAACDGNAACRPPFTIMALKKR